MNYRIATAIFFLAMAPTAHAITITDETPARAITIGKPEGDLSRVVFAPEVITMKECREALTENAEALKENSVAVLCVPADMRETGKPIGDLPFLDLTK